MLVELEAVAVEAGGTVVEGPIRVWVRARDVRTVGESGTVEGARSVVAVEVTGAAEVYYHCRGDGREVAGAVQAALSWRWPGEMAGKWGQAM